MPPGTPWTIELERESVLRSPSLEGRRADEWRELWFGHSNQGAPPVLLYERVGSTNTIARQLAEQGAPDRTIIIADEQSAGRGRGTKTFTTPPGKALLLSILIRPTRRLDEDAAPGTIPLRVGLAAARALDQIARTRTMLKWPNDLQLERDRAYGKVAGILCEGSLTTRGGGFIIAGIGVNLTQHAGELPTGLSQTPTSVYLSTGKMISRGSLAGAIIQEIESIHDRIMDRFDDSELRELQERDPLLDHQIMVDGEPAGVAKGVAPDGTLQIIGGDGRTTYLRNGTVRPIIP